MPEHVDEDLIEATIRRVAEAKAAREGGEPPAGEEDAPPATSIADARGPAATDGEPPDDEATAAAGVDEDLIEATIRRVNAQKAARIHEASVEPASAEPAPPAEAVESILADEAPAAVVHMAPVARDGAAATPEQSLAQAAAALQGLVQRLETLVPELERLAAAPPAARGAPQDDDGWDDTPRIAPVSFGTPPRPAVLRDPSPRTATAEHLVIEPDRIDTRPLPKPLPPLQVESKRGLDLLPRTYRITVEDKRRGVDLVPLHRALLSMEGVKDMSLLSYNNGVAIVSLEMTSDLETGTLEQYVSRAMSRDAKVEQHNELTFVVKLAED